MGKLHKEDDAAAAQSKSVGRKREVGRKMIYLVTAMGFFGLLQLTVMENRWYWSTREQSPSTTTIMRSSTSAQHAVLPNSSRSPPCTCDCASNNHSEQRNDDGIETTHEESKPIVAGKNEKLLEFKGENTFLPMKDETQPGMTDTDTNWFMSGLRGRTPSQGSGETFDLPGDDPEGRLLCVRGNHPLDGTQNGYGLFRGNALPVDSILLDGTTFVVDNYWDYGNPWHAMSALANFVTWHMEHRCATPDRLLLYHKGELIVTIGSWITHVLQAVFMTTLPIETLKTGNANASFCFERAVVQRQGLGGVDAAHLEALFDVLRCKARRYCGIRRRVRKPSPEVSLYTRTGPRAFANETGVAAVVGNECSKLPGCNLRIVNSANLTFCEQVELMSGTDVLISVHGAQLTNIMFLSPGSRVMEMFPKGWLELAGIGQEIYKWLADWTGVIHGGEAGRWRDPEGPDCPYPASETLECFFFFKDREVGLNETHLALWTRSVLEDYRTAYELHHLEEHSCA